MTERDLLALRRLARGWVDEFPHLRIEIATLNQANEVDFLALGNEVMGFSLKLRILSDQLTLLARGGLAPATAAEGQNPVRPAGQRRIEVLETQSACAQKCIDTVVVCIQAQDATRQQIERVSVSMLHIGKTLERALDTCPDSIAALMAVTHQVFGMYLQSLPRSRTELLQAVARINDNLVSLRNSVRSLIGEVTHLLVAGSVNERARKGEPRPTEQLTALRERLDQLDRDVTRVQSFVVVEQRFERVLTPIQSWLERARQTVAPMLPQQDGDVELSPDGRIILDEQYAVLFRGCTAISPATPNPVDETTDETEMF